MFTSAGSSSPESVNVMKVDESNAELVFVTQPALITIPALRTIRGFDVQLSRKVSVEILQVIRFPAHGELSNSQLVFQTISRISSG